uniref:Uncharacterized protein n=1 Tax=Glycine max TaxID=3847 RepID=C6T6G7_SOYBN|nr:unknown [Glycine max]
MKPMMVASSIQLSTKMSNSNYKSLPISRLSYKMC